MATTWYVDSSTGNNGNAGDAPGNALATIQAAIDAAADGDTILVYPGSYTESANYNDADNSNSGSNPLGLLVNKSVTIQGVDASGAAITDTDGIQATVVSSHQSGWGTNFFVTAPDVTIAGLEFQATSSAPTVNKGIEVVEDGFTLQHSVVTTVPGKDGWLAGAIYFQDWTSETDPSGFVSAISSFTIDGNVLDGTVLLANGTGQGHDAGDLDMQVTNNTFVDLGTLIGIYAAGRHDGIGWYNLPSVMPNVVTGNDFSDGAGRYLYEFDQDPAEVGLDRAYVEAFIANNQLPEYAYAVDGSGNLLMPTVDWASQTLTYAELEDLIGGLDVSSGDTVFVSTGGKTIDETIDVDNLTIDVQPGGLLNLTLDPAVTTLTLTGDGDANVTGNANANVITGNDGENTIDGAGGRDTIDADGGDDLIIASAGNDTIDGGDGTDTYSLAENNTTGGYVDLDGGVAFGGGQTGIDSISNIENVRGGIGADGLFGTAEANTFFASAGDDTIDGRGGDDTYDASATANGVAVDLGAGTANGAEIGSDGLTSIENATGGGGADTITGTSGINVLEGGDGDDTITGAGGDDTIEGGAGTDTAVFGDSFDNATFGTGSLLVTTADGTDELDGIEELQFTDRHVLVVGAGSEYATLQAAVDASVDGDTILIADGTTLTGQTVVDGKTNLTIMGMGDGSLLRMADSPVANNEGVGPRDTAAVLSIVNSDNIVVKDLKVDGRGIGPGSAADMAGIFVADSSGSIDDVTVTGTRDPYGSNGHVSGNQRGMGIIVRNLDGETRTFDVTDSTVADFQKNGITVLGAGLTSDISGNDVTGDGFIPAGNGMAQNGIQVSGGVAATVNGNTISEIGRAGDYWGSGYILAYAPASFTATGNTINGTAEPANNFGIFFIDVDDAVVQGNTVDGVLFGIIGSGDIDNPTVGADQVTNIVASFTGYVEGTVDTPSSTTYEGTNLEIYATGNDLPISFSASEDRDILVGSDHDDTLSGEGGNDEIDGGAGNDTLDGGAGADAIEGGDGDDRITGGTGTDTIDGGADDAATGTTGDVAVYSGALTAASFTYDDGTGEWSVASAADGTETLTEIETVEDGSGSRFLLVGAGGFDTIQEAVDVATSGDVILVSDGDYGPVTIDVGVTLLAMNDGEVTITGAGVNQGAAIRIEAGVDGVRIGSDSHGFDIQASSGDLAAIHAAGSNDGLVVQGNTVDGGAGHAFLGGGTGGAGLTNATIDQNEISSDGPEATVYVNGQASLGVTADNVDFTGNTITGGAGAGLLLGTEAGNSDITGNTFQGESGYAQLELWEGGNTVTANSFEADGDIAIADSAGNYDESDLVSGNTTFVPGAVYIVGQDNVFTSIQAAIDAATPGSTIMVGEGTYAENLSIDRAVNLVGVGDVTIAPVSGDAVEIDGDLGDGDVGFDNIDLAGGGSAYNGIDIHAGANIGTLTFANGSISGFAGRGIFSTDYSGTSQLDTIGQLDVSNASFSDNGTGSGNTAHVKLFGFAGGASFTDVTMTGGDALGTTGGVRPDNAIEITGSLASSGSAHPVPADSPDANVVIDNVTVSGAYDKNPLALFHFDSVDGVSITDLDLTGAESGWGPLFNIDGIKDDSIDASGFDITFPSTDVVHTELQAEEVAQGEVDTVITGTDGNDSIHGKSGDDTLVGGDGDDVLYGGNKPGGDFEDGDGNDTLIGQAGDDRLVGGIGDDVLEGGAGDDTYEGGAGTDTAIFADGGGAPIDLSEFDFSGLDTSGGVLNGTITRTQGGTTETETLSDMELLEISNTGSSTFLVLEGMSIQAAIDAASDGDKIMVGKGTFTENLVIDKELTLLGAQAGNAIAAASSGSARSGGETVINASSTFGITVTADNVTIDGFEITGFGRDGINVRTLDGTNPDDASVGAYRHDVTIQNNWIHGSATGGQQNGIVLGEYSGDPVKSDLTAELENLTISGNHVDVEAPGFGGRAIVFTSHFSLADGKITFVNADIDQNLIEGSYVGIFGSGETDRFFFDGASITGNTFQNSVTGLNAYNLDGSTISGNVFTAVEVGALVGVTGSTIDDNDFSDFGIYGLGLWGDEYGEASSNSTISNNDFTYNDGATASDFVGGIVYRSGADADTLGLENNSFTDGGVNGGIRAYDVYWGGTDGDDTLDADVILGGADVQAETISLIGGEGADGLVGGDNADELLGGAGNDTLDGGAGSDVVDGGAGDDEIVGDLADSSIAGGDDFDTLLFAAGTPAGDVIAKAADISGVELIRIGDTPGSDTWVVLGGMSIQDAIDAATSGDTIRLGVGTFAGDLVVGKELTFVGANAGTTGTDAGRGSESVIEGSIRFNAGSDDSTLDGLRIEGAATGGQLVYVAADGITISNSVLDGDYPTDSDTRGILTTGNADGLTVSDNLITELRSGIYFNVGTDAVVTGNTFSGNGNGINADGPAMSDVSGNIFEGSAGAHIALGAIADGADMSAFVGSNTFDTPSGVSIYPLSSAPDGQEITGTDLNDSFRADIDASWVNQGAQTFHGLDGEDNIQGGGGNDTLHGDGGNDTIGGGAGDDTLEGGAGDDELDGGDGIDTATFAGDLDDADIAPGSSWTVDAGSDGEDTLTGVEIVVDNGGGTGSQRYLLVGSDGFATLSDALAEAKSGDIILLDDGPHDGNVSVDLDVTIKAAEGANPVFVGGLMSLIGSDHLDAYFEANHPSYSSSTGLTINADGVTIDGLTFQGFGQGIALGTSSGVSITNSTFTDNVTGIRKSTAANVTGATISNNVFSHGIHGMTVYAAANGSGAFDGVTMDGNAFSAMSEKGMYLEQISNASLDGNSFDDVGNYGRVSPPFGGTDGEYGQAIDINLKYGTYENVTFTDTQITNSGHSNQNGAAEPGAFGAAIGVKIRDDGSYASNPADFNGQIVFDGGSIDGTSTGFRVGEPGQDNDGPDVLIDGVLIENATVTDVENATDPATGGVTTVVMADGQVTLDASASQAPVDVTGTDGDNVILGGSADDTMAGGDGNDTYLATSGDTIVEAAGEGTDTVMSRESITLSDNVENLTLLDAASNSEDFEDFDTGPIADGENGWTYHGGTRDQQVVDVAGDKMFKISSDPSSGDFAGPYTPELGVAAGESTTSAGADSIQASFTFQAVDPDPADNSTLEVDFGVAGSSDRNNYMRIENTGTGIRIAVSDPNLDGSWTTGDTTNDFAAFTGNTPLIEGVDPTVAHTLTMVMRHVDGQDNDVVEIYLDGDYIGQSTSFENYRDALGGTHADNAEANQTAGLFFRTSSAGAETDGEGNQNEGFYFDDIQYSSFDSDGPSGTGNALDNVITGNSGHNALSGLGGNDTISGGVGDDTVTGGAGDDDIAGGIGTDTAVYAGNKADFDVDLEAGTITDRGSGTEGADSFSGIEIVEFADSGTAGRILIVGAGGFATLQAALDAAQANDTIMLAKGTVEGDVVIGAGLSGLTILGANAGTSGTDAGRDLVGGTDESTIAGRIVVLADGVTIDGVRIDEGGAGGAFARAGIHVQAANTTIQNSVFFNSGGGTSNGSRAIITSVGSGDGIQVLNNAMSGWHTGTYLNGATDATVQGNAFTGNLVGMSLDAYAGATGLDVSDNVFDNNLEDLGIGSGDGSSWDGSVTSNTFDGPGVFNYDGALGQDVVEGNTFNGTTGDDTLTDDSTGSGRIGDNTLDGDGGSDTADYGFTTAGVTVDLGSDSATGAEIGTDTLTAIENAEGGSGDDDLTGDAEANVLSGNGGADLLNGAGGTDTLSGGEGADTLTGGAGDDELDGGEGIDTATFADTLGEGDFTPGGSWSVGSSTEGTDDLTDVEIVKDGSGSRFLLVGSDGFATLQAAIDEAEDGDTILVAAGDYGPVTVDVPNLTILAAEDGVSITGADGASQGSAIRIAAGVDGFTLGGNGHAIEVNAGSGSLAAIYAVGDNDGVSILGNDINAGGEHGFLSGVSGAFGLSNSVISDNVITSTGGAAVVYVDGPASHAGTVSENVEISNNDISAGNDAPGQLLVGLEADNSFVNNNAFSGTAGYGQVEIFGTGNVVNGNSFEATGDAVLADNGFTDIVQADGNWFGTTDHEEIDGMISDKVSVADYLTSGTDGDGGAPGFVGSGSLADTPVQNVTQGTGYFLLASAVAAAVMGDTLEVAAGDYSGESPITVDVDNLTVDAVADAEGIAFDLGTATELTLAGEAEIDVTGDGDNETITGNDGDNVIAPGAGDDSADGGDGIDTLDYGSSTSNLTVALDSNAALGGDIGSDIIENFENVRGGSGNDQLFGDTGDNVFYASLGNDTINGGGGNDTYDASASTNSVTALLALNTAGGTGIGNDRLEDIDNVIGGSGNDNLNGDGQANRLVGNGGNDTLTGNAGNDTLEGGAGTDNLKGGADNDLLTGGAGNDTVNGGDGTDTAVFSADFDEYTIDYVNGTITDTVAGRDGTDTLTSIELLQFADRTIDNEPPSDPNGTDFNGDFEADILVKHSGGYAQYLPSGDWDAPVNVGNLSGQRILGGGDFNGDGKSDVLTQFDSSDHIRILLGASQSTIQEVGTLNAGETIKAVGDFDGDGSDDLLTQFSGGYTRYLGGGSQSDSHAVGNLSGRELLSVNDFNGDGADDLLVRWSGGLIQVVDVKNGATTNFGKLSSGETILGVGDFNGNGTGDLLTQFSSGYTTYYESTVKANLTVVGTLSNQTIEGIGDFDDDGASDLLTQFSGGYVRYLSGADIGSSVGVGNVSGDFVSIADYDGNGEDDILVEEADVGTIIHNSDLTDTSQLDDLSGVDIHLASLGFGLGDDLLG